MGASATHAKRLGVVERLQRELLGAQRQPAHV